MSEEPNGDLGRDRATVALVNAKIDTVLAKVQGNAETTAAHLETISTRLDSVSGLGGRMDTVEQKVSALTNSVSHIEKARAYRSTTLPPILIGLASLLVAIAALYIAGTVG